MVNSEELICTTGQLTLQARYRINRCHYSRVRLYFEILAKLQCKQSSCSDSCFRRSQPELGDQTCHRDEEYGISTHQLGKVQKMCQFKHHISLSEAYSIVFFSLPNYHPGKFFLFHQPMHYTFLQQYIKIYIKIYTKIAPTCFGLTTILRERLIDLS